MLTTRNGTATKTNRPEGMPSQNGLTNIKKAGANASAFYIFEELILHSVNLLCKLGFQISSLVLMDN